MAFYQNAMVQYNKVCRKTTTKTSSSPSLLRKALTVPKTTPLSSMVTSTMTAEPEKKNPPQFTWILPKPTAITPASSCNELVNNNNNATPIQDLDDKMDTSLLLEPNPLPLPDVILPIHTTPNNMMMTTGIVSTVSDQDLSVHTNSNNIPEHTLKMTMTNRAPSMTVLADKLGSDSTRALIELFARRKTTTMMS